MFLELGSRQKAANNLGRLRQIIDRVSGRLSYISQQFGGNEA
jgi:hypothetical protein